MDQEKVRIIKEKEDVFYQVEGEDPKQSNLLANVIKCV